MPRVTLTARQRLEPWANVSRVQSDEETYGLFVDVAVAGGGAANDDGGSSAVDDLEHAERKGRVAAMNNDYTRCIPMRNTCPLRNYCARWVEHDPDALAESRPRVSIADLSTGLRYDEDWTCTHYMALE